MTSCLLVPWNILFSSLTESEAKFHRGTKDQRRTIGNYRINFAVLCFPCCFFEKLFVCSYSSRLLLLTLDINGNPQNIIWKPTSADSVFVFPEQNKQFFHRRSSCLRYFGGVCWWAFIEGSTTSRLLFLPTLGTHKSYVDDQIMLFRRCYGIMFGGKIL